MDKLTIDLGKIPIVVTDEESAQRAAEYVQRRAIEAIEKRNKDSND